MSVRVEAAARAMAPEVWGPRVWTFAAHGESPTEARDRVQRQALEDAERTLVAADAVTFNDAAIERVAIALGVKQYPMIEGFWADVDAEFKEKCRDQARAVIAALKGDDA